MPNHLPIPIGTKFSRIITTGHSIRRLYGRKMVLVYPCLCNCGKELFVTPFKLRSGHTQSCGCLHLETLKTASVVHGRTGTRIYRIWRAMLTRCHNENQAQFNDYGGRGIGVCDTWDSPHGFPNFLAEMGEGKKGWTLERVNNGKGYSVWNCVWATRVRQNRNKRNNKVFTVLGITACTTELCERFGLPYSTVQSRLRDNWPVEKAFTQPRRDAMEHLGQCEDHIP